MKVKTTEQRSRCDARNEIAITANQQTKIKQQEVVL
jgi:hypothetical protein